MLTIALCIQTRIYREGLAGLLKQYDEIGRVDAYGDISQLACISNTRQYDVILTDTRLDPDSACLLKNTHPPHVGVQSVVVLGLEDSNDDSVLDMLEAGASGYVTTSDSIEDLVQTLHAVTRGELCCTPRIARRLQQRLSELGATHTRNTRLCRLSQREIQVLGFIRRGCSNKQIARELSLELSTVKNHIHNLISKLHVKSRREAALAATDTSA